MLNELKVFVRAVELKSISAAARNLRLSAAAASHRILQLEEQVGVRLLNRTTRSLQPTEAGCIFYEHALNVLEAVERAESSMAMASGVPTGSLRVAAPLGFGRRILAPLVSEFHSLHPKVEVRLRLSDHAVDLLSESVDVAIRMSALPDSSFIVRKLADCPRVLVASPSYIAKHGAPESPEDLLQHNCLLLRFPGSTDFRWTLNTPDGPSTLPVSGKFDADDGDVLTEWTLEGEGIMLKPYWEVAEHLRTGRLQVVLPNHPPEPVSLVMLYPHRHLLPAKVRVFADFLIEKSRLLIERPPEAEGEGKVAA
ncbi:MAG: LysR family transcriptional regulator [Caulobacteraceae bacterium]